jgi:hypothetical protein
MTRSILAGVAIAMAVAVLSGTGCQASGVGDPCLAEREYDPSFLGFALGEVNIESRSFQCQTRLCLVNHFQGLVSCPYGQGTGPTGAPALLAPRACFTPISEAVTGRDANGKIVHPGPDQATVVPQCANRTADKAVYCSCRCQNLAGRTDDGANYCTCPDGFACTQLVSSIGTGENPGLLGAYCIKNDTAFDPTLTCQKCDPAAANCGTAQGVNGM